MIFAAGAVAVLGAAFFLSGSLFKKEEVP